MKTSFSEATRLTAPTLADARWEATARFVGEKFDKLPEFGLFFPAFRGDRDWAPLHVYADRLEDFGLSREAAKLRDLLQRPARRA